MRTSAAKALLLLAPLFILSACGGGGGGGDGTATTPAPAATAPINNGAGGSGDDVTARAPEPAPVEVVPDPVVTDPVVTDPVVADPVVPDPVVPDPVVPDPVIPGPVPPILLPPGAGGGVNGNSHGPAPLNLQGAGYFAVLAETAITTVSPSVIHGNVGLGPASAANLGLSCAQVTGSLYTVDAAGSRPCQIVDPGLLNQVVGEGHTAWHVARDDRPADYTEVSGGNIGGMTLPPATYRWSTGVRIPTNLTLQGGPNDVWIFIVQTDLVVSPGVQIILAGGAMPQNVFWVTLVNNVEIGAGAYFRGVILAETFIDMKTGASIDGRLMAAQGINLDGNTINEP